MTSQRELIAIGVRTKRREIMEKIEELEEELHELQETCPHPNVNKQYHSNSGNYDPSQDCEWYSFTCPDCDKRWTEEAE